MNKPWYQSKSLWSALAGAVLGLSDYALSLHLPPWLYSALSALTVGLRLWRSNLGVPAAAPRGGAPSPAYT